MADVLMVVWGLTERSGAMACQVVTEKQCEAVRDQLKKTNKVECIPLKEPA
jgi:hypothetical protein